ncbi:MAG: ATP-binding protein [Solirubrobacteraceae bacterium]
MRFRTLRGRLTALATLVAVVAIAALTTVFNVLLSSSLAHDADARLRSRAAAAATTVTTAGGRLKVRESPDDAAIDRGVWIFEGRRALARPDVPARIQRAADGLAGRSRVFRDIADELRLYAAPITSGGRQVGTVVVAQSQAAYDRTTDLALIGSLALAGVLLASVLVLTWILIGRALSPVREMTRSAADWGEHDSGARFGSTERPGELGALAATFDALLDRVAGSLRHEQRLSAELSHELRTPLARIVAQLELLQRRERGPEERREAYAAMTRSAEQMSAILETLMAAARADARLDQGRSDVRETLGELAAAWPEDRVTLEVREPEGPMIAGVDAAVVERIVAPLLDNARRYAATRVSLAAERRDGGVLLTVTDDGPGVPPAAREAVFEPGGRAGAPNGHSGAGLGLALARRLARAAGGDVSVAERAPGEGAQLRVELPG